jgi:hypothetical protein
MPPAATDMQPPIAAAAKQPARSDSPPVTNAHMPPAAAADMPPAAAADTQMRAAAASQEGEVEEDLDPADFWGKEDQPPDRGEGWTTYWATPEHCGGEYAVHGIE